MPRIETIRLVVTTGTVATQLPVRVRFNGHEIDLEKKSGGVGKGEVFEGTYDVGSFCHSCVLLGPKSGEWQVAKIVAAFEGSEPVKHELPALTLKPGDEVNIWDPPPPVFDV
jgi:hypothetical protein